MEKSPEFEDLAGNRRMCGRRRRTRTAKVRTALSCPCPAGQTDNGQSFSQKSGQNPDTGQNRDRQSPDRQTPESLFSKNPDRILTPDRIETDRIRTDRHRTVNPDRIQTADRFVRKIRIKVKFGFASFSLARIDRFKKTKKHNEEKLEASRTFGFVCQYL